ncbi:MAG TPA: hypothetical protein VH353_00950 [Caulobacteraceae bacterium]|nr:hypothetical protein [Caulobacteraceae bacterium]
MLALRFAFYSFMRIHKTLKVTPAVAAGVADRLRSMGNISVAVDARAPKPGRYKKRAA